MDTKNEVVFLPVIATELNTLTPKFIQKDEYKNTRLTDMKFKV